MSNTPDEKDSPKLNLPEISSMDYYNGRLFVSTDLSPEAGDLAVLRRQELANDRRLRHLD